MSINPNYIPEHDARVLIIEINPTTDQPTGHYRVCETPEKIKKYFHSSEYVVVPMIDGYSPHIVFHDLVYSYYIGGQRVWCWRE